MTVRRTPDQSARLIMSPTQPATTVDGTLWVDTDSDVTPVNPDDYVSTALFTDARQLLSSTASGTPAVIAIEDDQIILSNQVFN